MFLDASALCAVLLAEDDAEVYDAQIAGAAAPITSPVAIFEAVLAVARVGRGDIGSARRAVDAYLAVSNVKIVAIGEPELARALDAFDRFGKGRHPARLNLGDCFAYACARVHGTALLFKGDDFSQTDITAA
ncbi:MAG TPA: type II toxin-antitoxin system VapC family toxin [Phenylobacterium sp.]